VGMMTTSSFLSLSARADPHPFHHKSRMPPPEPGANFGNTLSRHLGE
jgi:hypothetical protein